MKRGLITLLPKDNRVKELEHRLNVVSTQNDKKDCCKKRIRAINTKRVKIQIKF